MVDPIEVNKYYIVDSMPYLISLPVCTPILGRGLLKASPKPLNGAVDQRSTLYGTFPLISLSRAPIHLDVRPFSLAVLDFCSITLFI